MGSQPDSLGLMSRVSPRPSRHLWHLLAFQDLQRFRGPVGAVSQNQFESLIRVRSRHRVNSLLSEVTLDEMRQEIAASMTSEMTLEKMIKTSDFLYAFLEGAIVVDSPMPGITQGNWPTGRPGERAPHFGLLPDEAPIWMNLVCRTLGWVPWIRIWVGATLTRSSLDLFGESFVLLTVPDQAERWRKAAEGVTTRIQVLGVGRDVIDLHGDFRKLCRIKDGAVLVGSLVEQHEQVVTLQTTTERVTVPRAEIKRMERSLVSTMPEGLLQWLSEQEVVDLVAFLQQ